MKYFIILEYFNVYNELNLKNIILLNMILHNLKKSTNKTIINELYAINKDNNINNKFQNIIEIYEKMTNKDKNIINNNDEIVNNKNPHHLFNLNISGIKFDTGINNSNFFKEDYNLITTNNFKLQSKDINENIIEEKKNEFDNSKETERDIINKANNSLEEKKDDNDSNDEPEEEIEEDDSIEDENII